MAAEKKLQLRIAAGIFAAATLLAASAGAHHTAAMYDHKKLVAYEGTVVRFQWTNPHTYTDIDVNTPSGVQRYSFEAPNNGWLKKYGWTRSTLKPGDRVKVTAHPLRDGRLGGALVEVTLANGKKMNGGYGSLGGDDADSAARTPATSTP